MMKRCLLILALFCGMAQAIDVHLVNEKYYCPITVSGTLVTASQSNYPWIVQAAAMPTGANGLWANCRIDGGDIRFTSDAAGVNVYIPEVKNFNLATPTGTFYFNIPSLAASSNTIMYVWYGDPNLTNPGNTTWSSDGNYDAVFHFEQAQGVANVDSTGGGNDLTPEGTTKPTTGACQIDNGHTYNGANYCDTTTKIPETGAWTIEAWVHFATDVNGDYSWIANYDSTETYCQYGLMSRNPGQIEIDIVAGPTYGYCWWLTDNNVISTTGAYHIVCVSDGTIVSGKVGMTCYVNGVSKTLTNKFASMTALPATTDCGKATVGRLGEYNGLYLKSGSTVDEVRMSHVVRSADWIKTGYNNQKNLSTSGTPGTPVFLAGTTTTGAFFID